jgi:hypothetical protein
MRGLCWCASWRAGLGVGGLLERVTVKKRNRGYSASQAILGLCEALLAGGECLEDVALLRVDSAQELLRGHGLPDPSMVGRFLRRFNLGHIRRLDCARRAVRARAPAARSGDGDARSRRELHRASRPGRIASGHARHLHRQSRLASASSPRRVSGCTASSATATPPPRPARAVSWPSVCAVSPPGRGCFCAPTRASGVRTSSPSASGGRSPTRSARRRSPP